MPGRYHYQTLWADATPGSSGGDSSEIVLGTRVRFGVDGAVLGARFYHDHEDDAAHVAFLMDGWNPGLILRSAVFHPVVASHITGDDQWQTIYFPRQLKVSTGDEYVVAVYFGRGGYWREPGGLSGAPRISEDLTAIEDGDGGPNGIFTFGTSWDLSLTFGGGFYGIDVVFRADTEVRP